MPDVHDTATRSRNMAAITGRDTKPELIIRKALHARGFRYRLHVKDLPGRPDMVFPRYRAALFVNGCFWHGHDCDLFRWPRTREDFWRNKISANVRRDGANHGRLEEAEWRVGVVWECALKGPARMEGSLLTDSVSNWLTSATPKLTLRGNHELYMKRNPSQENACFDLKEIDWKEC
jgi:DNA mismatch endonuclease (patch repair protein)